jgi:hypothetical protein
MNLLFHGNGSGRARMMHGDRDMRSNPVCNLDAKSVSSAGARIHCVKSANALPKSRSAVFEIASYLILLLLIASA